MKTEFTVDEMREALANILLGMLRLHKQLVVEAMHIAIQRLHNENRGGE